jgi:hypothetical protein
MRFPKLILASLTFALAACASTPKGADSTSNTLTAAEITKANVPTAYEAVDRLRRRWFRDLTGEGEVQVYLNNQKLDGGKDALRQIPAQDVASLEYLKGTDAVMRFGQDAKGGAIIVNRK